MTDYNDRYSSNWSTRAKKIRKMTKGQCSNCWLRKSQCVHHMAYRDSFGAIAGRELGGIHCVPLCDRCHGSEHRNKGSAHGKNNWIVSANPVLDNRNTIGYRFQAVVKFWIFWILLEYWFLIVPGLSAIFYLKF